MTDLTWEPPNKEHPNTCRAEVSPGRFVYSTTVEIGPIEPTGVEMRPGPWLLFCPACGWEDLVETAGAPLCPRCTFKLHVNDGTGATPSSKEASSDEVDK